MDQKAQIIFRSKLKRNTPTISIILTTFNGAADLQWNLTCLEQQTFKDFEVVICDDGSTDDSISIARQFSSKLALTYLRGQNFGGPARGRNSGINLAEGQYIAFLDVDDWWTPEKLEISLKELNKGYDLVYHPLYRTSKRTPFAPLLRRRIRTRRLTSPIKRDLLTNGNAVPNSSIVVRKAELTRILPIDEDRQLIASEDFDMLIRISSNTEKFKYLRKSLGFYNLSNNSLSAGKRRIDSARRILEKHQNYLTSIGLPVPMWAKVLFSQDKRIAICQRRKLLLEVLKSKASCDMKLRSLVCLITLRR